MDHALTAARWLVLAALLALYALIGSGRIAAQVELPAALALARLCVNEAGISAWRTDDCSAIDAVIRWRMEHLPAYRGDTYVEALHRCSRGATVARGHRGRPWIVDLWPDGREPVDYCPTCQWEGRGSRAWARTYQHAVSIRQGEIEPLCAPHTWARSDVRPEDRSAVPVDCGRTLNRFWRVPAYVERWGGES